MAAHGDSAEVRQGGSCGAHHPEHVHVEHPRPFLHRVRFDCSLGADARVVDEHVDAAHRERRLSDGGAGRLLVSDVSTVTRRSGGPVSRVEVKHRHDGAACERGGADGTTDPRRTARHQHADARVVPAGGHAAPSRWRCVPRPSISRRMTSPSRR